ncbi:unnamed protein product [Arabidopsis lyrata]|uniref:Predicted protein n=1 Tax=Arabidopsis lyrata subsp. lyrata TaxID=81972 RepID=D7LBE0_ARALL|nr:predicted protein [Arabidopsis lyrata subsp. lyrata]CAH8262994.1 unnamed protein product [Arabidopsis lyrata]
MKIRVFSGIGGSLFTFGWLLTPAISASLASLFGFDSGIGGFFCTFGWLLTPAISASLASLFGFDFDG